MTENKKFKNPFIEAAQKAKQTAANPSVPGNKTSQVRAAKLQSQVNNSKPPKRNTGRGR